MKKLTVLYDAECYLCRRCRSWLSTQPAYLELEFLPAQSRAAAERYPAIASREPPDELVVVSDDGRVYRGPNAYIMCLYALKRYRALSLRLARPWLLPFARRSFDLLSSRRGRLSEILVRARGARDALPRERPATSRPGADCAPPECRSPQEPGNRPVPLRRGGTRLR